MKSKWLLLVLVLVGVLPLSPAWPPPARADSTSADHARLGEPVSTGNVPSAYSGCGGVIAPVVNADYEQQVVDLVNTERANQSLPPLKRLTQLDQPARYHATDMGQDNYFNHDSYDGSGGNTFVCAWTTRVASYYSGWISLAENIAVGQTTSQDAMTSWMNSPGHKANILSTTNSEIGVGYYEGSGTYYRYWVQDFGTRNGVYPLVINRDAATSNTQTVSIYLYGVGIFQDMRLKNDNGGFGNWQPFQSSFNWTLGIGTGTHTVYAELRNGSTTVATSDSIYLNGPVLGNIPDALGFTYSNFDQALFPGSGAVTPLDMGIGSTLNWSLTSEGTWFVASPGSGTTPNFFTVTPTSFTEGIEATYTGAVTVTVASPSGVGNSPKRINLSLRVTNQPFGKQYLPLVKK